MLGLVLGLGLGLGLGFFADCGFRVSVRILFGESL